ncbi:MAG: hypothetical protein H0W08_19785 [Acidobacteria bacterium]|nr:hypothetical protein [Acidobacteriota bacterium]
MKRAVRGVETIALETAQIVVQPRARELAPDLEIDLLIVFAQPAHIAIAAPPQPPEKVADLRRDPSASGRHGQRPHGG